MQIYRFSESESDRMLEAVKEKLIEKTPYAFVFDFDGVLSSKNEDWIYGLEEEATEAQQLTKIASAWGLNIEGYDVPYQRHLLYQAAAAELEIPIEKGPGFRIVDLAGSSGSKIFVLSARSGSYAVKRMLSFLQEEGIKPVEIFQIGRVPKHEQIVLLLNTLRNHRLLFFEDGQAHVARLETTLGDLPARDRLDVFLIEYDVGKVDLQALRHFAWNILHRGARLREGRCMSRIELLKTGLEHARALFIYHAGQRVTSINIYFAALAFLITAAVTVLTSKTVPHRAEIGMALTVSAFIITLCLWALDWRNYRLVDGDEELLRDIEKELADLSDIRSFETIKYSDGVLPKKLRYKYILSVMFLLFLLLWVGGFLAFYYSVQ